MFYFAESDPAALYSAERTGDVSYGKIVRSNRITGTGPVFIIYMSFLSDSYQLKQCVFFLHPRN